MQYRRPRSRRIWEIFIVLGVSIFPSTLRAAVSLAQTMASPTPIGETATNVNPPVADTAVWDAIYRLISIGTALVPVALVIFLVWTKRESGFRRLGFDAHEPGRDLWRGVALAAAVAIPGLALYLGSRALGFTPQVVAGEQVSGITIVVLLAAAARAALVEEVIVVGYLGVRLREIGWTPWAFILGSALLRGSYHLYQGFAMALGNVVMGIVFACAYWYWRRRSPGVRRRVAPLVVAHFLMDAGSFLGYPLAVALWPGRA